MLEKMRKESKKRKIQIEVMDFIRSILLCIVVMYLCLSFLFRPVTVVGASMYPALEDGESGFSNVVTTFVSNPKRFDIVVVKHKEVKNSEEEISLWVKRVIGLPNETIEYRNDQLYVDGKKMAESFLNKAYVKSETNNGERLFTNDYGPITLGKNEYLLLGDNRLVSKDSRYESVGPFKLSDIVSKYILVVYPFDKMGYIKK
ncbi:MAG: signal peptidase I [Breznakia sp.]